VRQSVTQISVNVAIFTVFVIWSDKNVEYPDRTWI